MPPAIVEKDFWVCYMLDYLFQRSQWKDHLVFKGGTSLSKAYHLIQRFSEDIDLILDWRLLGYTASEPWETRSNTQQDKFSKQATQRTIQFLSRNLIPTLKADLSREIDSQFDVALEEAPWRHGRLPKRCPSLPLQQKSIPMYSKHHRQGCVPLLQKERSGRRLRSSIVRQTETKMISLQGTQGTIMICIVWRKVP